ncbi:MAG: hypothetical protein KDH97_13915 [Calditrichaeota bacterium]|nr:hypothetical protein [Calditrichota bacterium]
MMLKIDSDKYPGIRRLGRALAAGMAIIFLLSSFLNAETQRSLKSGRWSDRTVWSGNSVPGQGDDVVVDSGHVVLYDVASSEEIRTIHIRGKLEFSRSTNTQLDAGMIIITTAATVDFNANCSMHQHGPHWEGVPLPALEVGSTDNPIPDGITARIRLKHFSGFDPDCAPGIICYNGRMDFHGKPVNKTWVKIAQSAMEGENTVTVAEAVDWQPGDRIIVTRSQRPSGNITNTGSYADNGQIETEERLVAAVAGNTITLNEALEHDHPVWKGGRYAGEVALISRNVIVESKEPNGVRGHTMYHHGSKGSISYAEFAHLGKEGVLARYPIHYHVMRSSNRGSSVIGASIWDSSNRFITIHGTDYLVVRDCVGYKSIGHGFFMEDASEVNNLLENNLAVQAFDSDEIPNQALSYDDNDGAGFWWANPQNAFLNNVATETDRYGYQLEIVPSVRMSVLQPNGTMQPNVQIDQLSNIIFKDNEAHGTMEYGLALEGVMASTDDAFYVENMEVWGSWRALRPDLNNFYFKNLYAWNHAYGFYAIDPKNGRVENYHAINTGNHAMSFQDHPEGLITFEQVVIDSSNEWPFKVYGRDPRDEDCYVHVRDYTITNTEGGLNGASSTSGVEPTPYIALFLHDWFGPGQDAKVIPAVQNPNDGLNYQNMSPMFRNDIKVAQTSAAFPNNPVHKNDNMPPATVITYPADLQMFSNQVNSITVRGTCIDASEVTSVTVNGVQATPVGDNFTRWEVTLTNLSAGTMDLVAKGTDTHGNVELNPHRIRIGLGMVPTGTGDGGISPAVAHGFELGNNYPNPFNPETRIQFTVAAQGQDLSLVRLNIYNVLGHKVRELVNGYLTSGAHEYTWDGRDSNGEAVASGVYIYEMVAQSHSGQSFRQAKKMLLVR